ncbi:hypothetical protein Tco_1175214 [Tanacetum coccineum]
MCNTRRWKDSNTPGKKVPKKVVRYFLIIPRLQRLYKSSHTAKKMIWHAIRKCTEPNKMQHPVDGRACKTFDTKYPDFAKELRNVRLGLAADCFNPFGNLSQSYSMWPVILKTYNLPPWLCMKESSFMLTLCRDYRHCYSQKSNMRAMVLWTINDFPARSSLSGWSRKGYKACATCNEDTPSMRMLGKTTYVGHIRFLKKPHNWRRSLDFNGETEDGDPPRKFDRVKIMAQLARFPTRVKGKHLSPEIDTYCAKFKSEFPNQDMKENSLIRQRHIDKDPGVSASSELFALAYGTTQTPIPVNSCIVNGVRFFVHIRDDGEMYYGQLEEILEYSYMSFEVGLFRVKWFGTSNEGCKVKRFVIRKNMTQIWANEDDHDVIHFDNSSDLALSTSLNDLDFATMHIDGQSMDVNAPPDIIDVDEDDDIIDEKDAIPYDLVDSDDEDLVTVDDDDDIAVVYSNVARSHGGDGDGNDRPPPHQMGGGCRGNGTRKPNLGGRKAGRLNICKETQNLWLRRITDLHGPQPIRFEEFSMHYRSWHNISAEKKAGVLGKIGSQFDLNPHMQSDPENWRKIYTCIQQHLAKIYTNNKSALKAEHWVPNPEDETYDEEHIRSRRPANTSQEDWDSQIAFWSDPKNAARCAQNKLNQAKSTVICRQGSRSLAALRDMQMQSSDTREYPSVIQTYFDTHTVDGVFLRDHERHLYEDMLRLQGLGSNTPSGVPYTDDEIMANVRWGKQRGHIPGVGRVLVRQGMDVLIPPEPRSTHTADIQSQPEIGSGSGSGGAGDDESGDGEDADEDEEDEDS